MSEIITDLLGNQIFAGVAGAAVISAALFQLRALPGLAWSLATNQLTATLTVYSEQEAFRQIDLWLGRHPSAKASRRLALVEWWNQGGQSAEFEMTPGQGSHLLWEGRSPVLVRREVEGGAPAAGGAPSSGPRRQTLSLTTWGRSRALLERVVADARTVHERDVVPVYVWGHHGYQLVERRPRRRLETVYLADGLGDRIVADARRFIERRGWYEERGIPHRRGYLFEGPPGTGKSSMALAVAGELHRAIYIINPAAMYDDNALQTAVNQAGAGVVLIEDIDAVDVGAQRAPPSQPDAPEAFGAPTKTGISTSGLLNAIDGVAARDGRVLIITTNHAERLDPALIRPGRVDMRCHFGLANEAEAIAMHRRLCPERDERAFAAEIAPHLPLSQAELQNRLLRLAA